MPLYRVISLDILTGARVAELALTNLKYGYSYQSGVVTGYVSGDLALPTLNADVTFDSIDIATETGDPIAVEVNGHLDPVDSAVGARAMANILNDAVDECRRHLFVERDGVVVGDGIVWSSPYNPDTRKRSISAGSTVTYLNRRIITTRQTFTATDQFDIARALVNASTAEVNGNIGITVGTETSGVLRDRTYETFDIKNLGQALEELCSVERGFDMAIDCSWNTATGAPIKLLRLSYPRRGRNFTQSKHVFELGRNTMFDWPSTGTLTANRIIGVGSGEGDSMLTSTMVDTTALAANYPLLEATFSAKDVKLQDTLDIQTRSHLASKSKPMVLPKMTVRADRDPILGAYIVGDTCKVRCPPGTDSRYPDGFETWRRISAVEVTVDDQGGETVTVSTIEEPDA
jgi:hypothetical protein